MSTKYELEVLLRPAVELYSVIVCLCAALLLVIAPGLVLMPPTVAYGSAAVMVVWSVIDAHKVLTVWRYRVGMRGLPTYFVRSDDIPQAEDGLFLGRGFEWEQKHTQRLADTHDSRYRSFATQPSLIVLLFSLWRGKVVDGGGNPFLHGVGQHEVDLYLSNKARENHTLVLGVPGVGKTRDMELFITQDIHRKPHDTVIVVDPKGDAELLRRLFVEARAAGREKELIVFHLGHPDRSARYNAVESYSRMTEVATRLSNPLPSEGNSAAFKEFAWRFTNIIAKALFSFGETADYDKVRRYINDVEPLFIRVVNFAIEKHSSPSVWAERLAVLDEAAPKALPRPFTERTRDGYLCYELVSRFGAELGSEVAQDLSACFKYDRTYYDKLVSSISPLLEKLTSGKAGKLLSPDYLTMDDPRPMFTWEAAIRSRSIVYIGLDALSDTTVSSAVGNSMLSDLVSIAGRIYKQGLENAAPKGSDKSTGRIWLHFDEINEIAGEEFIPMVNKCRGAGMYVTAYTQAVQDIETRMGSHAKAAQTLGNLGNKIYKRVGNKESAQLLTDTLPAVHIASIMAVSGVNDSNDMMGDSHFSSRNEDRISSETVSLLEPASVMQLPIGHSLASTGGGRLLKIRSPLLQDREDDNEIPYDIQSLIDAMAVNVDPGTNWATESQWWHEDLTHV